MKTSRAFTLITLALGVGFIAARWSVAQSATGSPSNKPIDATHNLGLDELTRFVSYLESTKQTNALKFFNGYSNARIAQEATAEIGMTVAILQRFRAGQTNSAFELLEGRLDTHIIGLEASYKELGPSQRERLSLTAVQYAREYRAKFPFKHRYPETDKGVADALRALGQNAAN